MVFDPRRYDSGTPIRTRLENGPVEVVNLIADRSRFEIDLRGARWPAGRAVKSSMHPQVPDASPPLARPTICRKIKPCAYAPKIVRQFGSWTVPL